MSAPYWGQLPGPKAAQARGRRVSDDYGSPQDQYYPSQDGTQTKTNRLSTQTTKSDAPTESTFTTFASPTPSSVHPQGLAPRPPSFPYGANQYPPELLEARRRRKSRNQEQELEFAAETPPPAPDAPPAPPSSYRQPFGNGGHPLPYPKPGARTTRQMEPGAYDNGAAIDRQDEQLPVLDRNRVTLDARPRRNGTDPNVASRVAGAQAVARGASGHQRRVSGGELAGHSRRASTGGQSSERQRKFTNERSPLQRLELTLDTISKEEKRARVEAAEQAARERAAGDTPSAKRERAPPSQQVRFTEEPADPAATPTRAAPAVQQTQRSPLAQNPPEEGRRYGSVSAKSPRTQAPDPRVQAIQATGSSGIPQRNLSFRERAVKNDLPLPDGFEDKARRHESPPVASPGGGNSVARNGSNKLRKHPPEDLRFNNRYDPDDVHKMVQFRPGPEHYAANVARDAGGPVPNQVPRAPVGPGRKPSDPDPAPAQNRLPPARKIPTEFDEIALATPSPPTPAKLVKAQSQRSQRKADQILGRSPSQNTANTRAHRSPPAGQGIDPRAAAVAAGAAGVVAGAAAAGAGAGTDAPHPHVARRDARDNDGSDEEGHHVSDMLYNARSNLKPGEGVFKPTQYLDEWKKATVGTLAGTLLNIDEDAASSSARDQAWWENNNASRRGGSISSRPKKAEAFDGEYDDNGERSASPIKTKRSRSTDSSPPVAPTRFKPPLYLKCGPLLRYCGLRQERTPSRSARNGVPAEREIWRGSVMIVTQDSDSQYDIAPTLRLFAQPIELLPPPPAEIHGDEPLAHEHVDPIAGHPKIGRKGETLFVRPVDHLDEAKDLSRDETDEGLFEKSKSPPDVPLERGMTDAPGSFAARRKRVPLDGEKIGKYKDVRGFKLHAERGYTFWRFNIEVELRDQQQRIAYRINRGPSTGFWVPAKGHAMNMMFHSCNGFSLSVTSDEFSGPDPMWRDVLNTHQSQPFHVMIGGGDQIYNDACMRQTKLFQSWLMIKNPLHKHNTPFTGALQDELEAFYLERYCMWFSQGLFGLANSQIPMVNMYDDHDIIDGFGSYPHHLMNSPVFSGLGNVAFKYYMLFQHQSVVDETETSEPSWLLGVRPGPYIVEQSRSLFMFLGSKVALLAVDARTERTRESIIREDSWKKIMDRCYAEIVKGKTEHLLVLLGVPIAYPRLVWLENM